MNRLKRINLLMKPVNIKNQYVKYRVPSFKSENYLIKWFPKVETDFHDHNGKQCDFYILGFYLEEIRKSKNFTKNHTLGPLQKFSINDKIGKHKVINPHDRVVWSYHKYY